MKNRLFWWPFAAFLSIAALAGAQLTWDQDAQVNTTTADDQVHPAVATDPSGKVLVVWEGPGIRGRWIAPDGSPLGDDFQVNTDLPARTPGVAAIPGGDFIVVWVAEACTYDTSCGVHGQRYGSDGDPVGGEFVVVSYPTTYYTTTSALDPEAVAVPNGSFAVVWATSGTFDYIYTSYTYSVEMQLFAQDGLPLDHVGIAYGYVDPEDGPPYDRPGSPAVSFRPPSEYVVAWRNRYVTAMYTDESYVWARRVAADGSFLGPPLHVNSELVLGSVGHPSVAASDDGFAVAWSAYPCMGADPSRCVQARPFAPDGAPLCPSLQVNVTTDGDQLAPVAAASGAGFTVTWESEVSAGSDLDGTSIQRALLSWEGEVLEPEAQVNTFTVLDQAAPAVSGTVVVWESDDSAGPDHNGTSIQGRQVPPLGGELRGWWRGEGDASDSSGMGNHGAVGGGGGFAAGQVGAAFLLDGVDDRVDIPDDLILDFGAGDLSITYWIKTDDAWPIVVDKRTPSPNAGYMAYLDGGCPGLQLKDASGTTKFTSSVDVSDWSFHFVAVAVDRDSPTGGHLWVDGQLALEFDPTGRLGSLDNTAGLRIGARGDPFGGDGYLRGMVDEVRLYGRALSEAEVRYLYRSGLEVGGLFQDGFESGNDLAWSYSTR